MPGSLLQVLCFSVFLAVHSLFQFFLGKIFLFFVKVIPVFRIVCLPVSLCSR